MKRVLLIFAAAVLIAGCAPTADLILDPALIDVAVSTDPQNPAVSEPLTLRADITGLPKDGEVQVDFELRKPSGKSSKYVTAKQQQPSVFIAVAKFEESGTNEVFIHIYTDTSHVTKMKELQIE